MATRVAIGRRFRCRECGRPALLEVRWAEHPPNGAWYEIVAASRPGVSSLPPYRVRR